MPKMPPDDTIGRQEAIACIHSAMRKVYTAARKTGYKECIDILSRLPAAGARPITLAEPTYLSPGLGRSYWFSAGGYRLCYNCGGKGDLGKPTRYCPHCGFIMNALDDEEIE